MNSLIKQIYLIVNRGHLCRHATATAVLPPMSPLPPLPPLCCCLRRCTEAKLPPLPRCRRTARCAAAAISAAVLPPQPCCCRRRRAEAKLLPPPRCRRTARHAATMLPPCLCRCCAAAAAPPPPPPLPMLLWCSNWLEGSLHRNIT